MTTTRLLQAAWALVVLALVLAALVFGHAHRGPTPPLALVLTILATTPLLAVPRWALVSLGLIVSANATFVVWARLPWPPTAVAAWLLALAACPLLLRRRYAVVMLVTTAAAVLASAFVPGSVNPRPWDAPVTEALAVLLVWGAAAALRSRRESEQRRIVVDGQMRDLHDREAVARGRAEIARELHDVVAHHVSLIAVRAATAPYQLGEVSDDTSAAFSEIATEARAALDDLRAVLGVLRAGDGQPPQAPQPCLADVPELLQRLRSTGMTVTYSEHGGPRSLGAAAELCCYRVIQEALTNAARYAPGRPVEVDVDNRDGEVHLTITDRGQGVHGVGPTTSGGGFGLVGMRERVAALGGDLVATRRADGFVVAARIPVSTTTRSQP